MWDNVRQCKAMYLVRHDFMQRKALFPPCARPICNSSWISFISSRNVVNKNQLKPHLPPSFHFLLLAKMSLLPTSWWNIGLHLTNQLLGIFTSSWNQVIQDFKYFWSLNKSKNYVVRDSFWFFNLEFQEIIKMCNSGFESEK